VLPWRVFQVLGGGQVGGVVGAQDSATVVEEGAELGHGRVDLPDLRPGR